MVPKITKAPSSTGKSRSPAPLASTTVPSTWRYTPSWRVAITGVRSIIRAYSPAMRSASAASCV